MLARRASDPEKLLARPQNLLVPDDRMGLLASPVEGKCLTFIVASKHKGITDRLCDYNASAKILN